MSYSEEQLRDAAAFLRNAYCDKLPDTSSYHPEYSEEFLRKMERLCRKYRFKRSVKAVFKTAAAAMAALLIAGSLWLGVNVEARAAFHSWVLEVYEKSFIYRFFNEVEDFELTHYDITKLPAGYTFVKEQGTSIGRIKSYSNNGKTLAFVYAKTGNHTVIGVPTTTTTKRVKVGKYSADFYLYDDGTANKLMWFDDKNEMALGLAGFLTEEELIEIAESVVIMK